MTTFRELQDAVDAVFAARDPQLASWPPPRPFDQAPADDEYSRVTNPEKWRIIGSRADAWVTALVDGGFATVEPMQVEDIEWAVPPHTLVTSAVRVRPTVPGGLPLIVARSRLDEVADAGVTLGVGDPAVWVGAFPDCGCDACDGGSAGDLEHLDNHLGGIVDGSYRRLARGKRDIVVITDGWSASGNYRDGQIEAIIANPKGWSELTGPGWLS